MAWRGGRVTLKVTLKVEEDGKVIRIKGYGGGPSEIHGYVGSGYCKVW